VLLDNIFNGIIPEDLVASSLATRNWHFRKFRSKCLAVDNSAHKESYHLEGIFLLYCRSGVAE